MPKQWVPEMCARRVGLLGDDLRGPPPPRTVLRYWVGVRGPACGGPPEDPPEETATLLMSADAHAVGG